MREGGREGGKEGENDRRMEAGRGRREGEGGLNNTIATSRSSFSFCAFSSLSRCFLNTS